MRRLETLEWLNVVLGLVLGAAVLVALWPGAPARSPGEPVFSRPVVAKPQAGQLSKKAAARAAIEQARRRQAEAAPGPPTIVGADGQPFPD